jgi:hypothetical protein
MKDQFNNEIDSVKNEVKTSMEWPMKKTDALLQKNS